MKETALKYLSDLLRSIELIEDFTKSISDFNEYVKDLKTQSAVERQLGIIGEAVNKYDLLFPDEPLTHARKIIGFRNRLIHAYDAVDASMVGNYKKLFTSIERRSQNSVAITWL